MRTYKRFTHLVISLLFYLWVSSRNLLLLIGHRSRKSSVVLYYHVISDKHRDRFAAQLDALRRWAVPVRTDVKGPVDEKLRHAAITFDDASETVVRNAFPELEKRSIPMTLFVIPGLLGQQVKWENYSDCIMSADEVLALSKSRLVTIGSHTVTHPMLPLLPEREARAELQESRRQLEELLQRKVALFSFPYGGVNDDLVRWCRETGYERVFTTLPMSAFNSPAQFVCGRIRVDPTDWALEFYLKVVGAYNWLPWAISIKRRVAAGFAALRRIHTVAGPVTDVRQR